MVLCFSTSKSSSLVSSLSSTISLRVHGRELHDGRGRGTVVTCRDRVIDGNTTNSPRRRDTVALAPHFQGPRPKDRGSVGSALVCRWPPGGVSGALRPPQNPQDLEETSLTSLWQPHRKLKQRGSKVRVSGPFLGSRCAAGHKTRTGHWTACLCPVKDVADVTVDPHRRTEKVEKGRWSFCLPVALPRRNSQLRRCPV